MPLRNHFHKGQTVFLPMLTADILALIKSITAIKIDEYIDNYRLVTTFSSIGFNQFSMYSNQSIFIDSYLAFSIIDLSIALVVAKG